LRRLLVIALLIELGLLLVVVPWSAYWERNYFAQISPLVETLVTNNYVRGAVTGLGAVNLLTALADLATLVRRRPTS
jgi:polyferredoxin